MRFSNCSLLVGIGLALAAAPAAEPVRVGIIGLDTSHVVAFTKLLNDASAPDHVPGARVVAGYKGGSPDVTSSASRVDRFTSELRDKWKVEIVSDIATLASKVDAVLLESVDGRAHLEQIKPVLRARKRVFIDKPMAARYRDARAIAELAAKAGVPWFSSSSLRFYPSVQALRSDPKTGPVLGASIHSPAELEPHHGDLFWYGIHGVEALFTILGPGCQSVVRMHAPGTDVVVGRWKDGRLGVFRGLRDGKKEYGATVYGRDGVIAVPLQGSYRELVQEIVKFFQTGVPPVSPEETLEIMAFMEAADVSKARNGQEVSLTAVTGVGSNE